MLASPFFVIASPSGRGSSHCEEALAEADTALLVKHSAQYVLARHLGKDTRDAFTANDLNVQGLRRAQSASGGASPLGKPVAQISSRSQFHHATDLVIPATRHLANRDVRGSHMQPSNGNSGMIHPRGILVDVKGLVA